MVRRQVGQLVHCLSHYYPFGDLLVSGLVDRVDGQRGRGFRTAGIARAGGADVGDLVAGDADQPGR